MKASPPEISFLRVGKLNLGFLEGFFCLVFMEVKRLKMVQNDPKFKQIALSALSFQ